MVRLLKRLIQVVGTGTATCALTMTSDLFHPCWQGLACLKHESRPEATRSMRVCLCPRPLRLPSAQCHLVCDCKYALGFANQSFQRSANRDVTLRVASLVSERIKSHTWSRPTSASSASCKGAPLSPFMYVAAASITVLVLAYTMAWFRSGVKLSGKHVIITGGSEGLGFCLARELCVKGCRVTIVARTQSKLDQALVELQELRVAAGVQALPADVTKFEQVNRLPSVTFRHCHNVADLV